MKKMFAIILALVLCLSLSFFGCTQTPAEKPEEGSAPSTEATIPTTEATEPTDDGKETYTVKVVDENGNPVTGGMIQFCLDSCIPCMLDAQGIATMNLVPANYKVSFTMMPSGYALAGEATEFYFAEGSFEMTIVLKAA